MNKADKLLKRQKQAVDQAQQFSSMLNKVRKAYPTLSYNRHRFWDFLKFNRKNK